MNSGRVALLLPCLLTGGTEVATLETASAFQALGYSVDVVVYFDEVDPTMLATFREKGLQVHLLGVPRGKGLLSFWGLALRLQQVLLAGASLVRPVCLRLSHGGERHFRERG
jgi:hypothetical protein